MNTAQLVWDSAGCFNTNGKATAMNVNTAINFKNTIPVLKLADSLIPIIKIVVTAIIARKATKLNLAVAWGSEANWSMGTFMEAIGDHRPWYCTQTAPGTS